MRQVHRIRDISSRLRTHERAMVQHEKMVAMGRMAAGVAHEIANPLAAMDSVLQLMQRNPGAPKPQTVTALREQIQRIHRTIRELTAFAHPGQGRSEVASINDVVRAALKMISFDGRLRTTRLETDFQDSAGSARLNPHALQQVLTNLVSNALDATAAVDSPRIIVATRREGAECIVEVRDNGCGITAPDLDRIFEPFFTTKPVGQGTGLGLSISAGLVREQGGRISVQSRPGAGTVFAVALPAVDLSDSLVPPMAAGIR